MILYDVELFPWDSFAKHCVEQCDELSHARDEGDHFEFSIGHQSLVKVFDDGIVLGGGNGGHVEDGSDIAPAGVDGAFSGVSSGVAVEGRHADERADLPSPDAAQFDEAGQEGGAEDRADTRRRAQEFVDPVHIVIGFDQLLDLLIEQADLLVQGFEDGVDALERGGAGGGVALVELRNPQLAELLAAGDQGIEFALVLRAFLRQAGLNALPELDQHVSIDRIGFNENAQRFGEVTHLAGIDQGNRQLGIKQGCNQRPLESAGGFDDDQDGLERLHQLNEAPKAAGLIVEGDDLVGIGSGQVEFVLGDVDANEESNDRLRDGSGVSHGRSPFLQMRASADPGGGELLRLFGRSDTQPIRTLLCDDRCGPRRDRSRIDCRVRMTPRSARRHANTTTRNRR